MESLPAMARLSLLHECTPVGVGDGDKYDFCQKCKHPSKLKLTKESLFRYCRDCTEKREAEKRAAAKAAEKRKADKAAADEKERLAAEAQAAREAKQAEAEKKKQEREAAKKALEEQRAAIRALKEARKKQQEAEAMIKDQMGAFANKLNLEQGEWAAFFGEGDAQKSTDDAEKPKRLDVLLEADEITEDDKDLIQHYTKGRPEDAMDTDRETCCTHRQQQAR